MIRLIERNKRQNGEWELFVEDLNHASAFILSKVVVSRIDILIYLYILIKLSCLLSTLECFFYNTEFVWKRLINMKVNELINDSYSRWIDLSISQSVETFLNTVQTVRITIFITLYPYLSIIAKHSLVILRHENNNKVSFT